MAKSLRIIMVVPEAPLPFGGAAARIYYTTQKGLVARGHHLTTFIASATAQARAEAERLFPLGSHDLRFFMPSSAPVARGLRGKWRSMRAPMSHQFDARFHAALASELHHGFDILHLEDLWTGYVGIKHRDKVLLNSHCLQAIDLQGERPASVKDRMLTSRSLHMEQKMLRLYKDQVTLTPELAAAIRLINPKAHVEVIPLPLELDLYPYITDEHRPQAKRLALIGSFQWAPTRSAARRLLTRLWPRIRALVPDAELELTGWGAQRVLSGYERVGQVTINDSVPEVRPYFERASVLLYAPEHASGMKVKVLECMALGVPVVTTPDGVEGLPTMPSGETRTEVPWAMLGASDEALVNAAVTLLNDTARQNRQRLAARQMLKAHCDPARILDQYEAVYARIMEARGR